MALAGAVILAAAGCGGGDGGASAGSLPSGVADNANAICTRGHRAMVTKTEGAEEGAKVALPVLENTIVHVARSSPTGGEKQLSAFILDFEDIVHTNENVQVSLSELEAQFKPVDAQAQKLGLTACVVG